MRKRTMMLLAVSMAIMLVWSAAVWAAEAAWAGSLQVKGVVLVNSIPMPDGGTVRSGDTITTPPGGLAIVTSPSWGRLEVRSDSEARLAADRVLLVRGVVASARLPAEVNSYTIQPQGDGVAWFAVSNREGRLAVAAHRGNVIIAAAGAAPVVVSQGSLASREHNPEPPQQTAQAQPAQEPRGKKKKQAARTIGEWTIGSLSHAVREVVAVGVGAAAAATAAGAAVALSDNGPSPSR